MSTAQFSPMARGLVDTVMCLQTRDFIAALTVQLDGIIEEYEVCRRLLRDRASTEAAARMLTLIDAFSQLQDLMTMANESAQMAIATARDIVVSPSVSLTEEERSDRLRNLQLEDDELKLQRSALCIRAVLPRLDAPNMQLSEVGERTAKLSIEAFDDEVSARMSDRAPDTERRARDAS